MQQRQQAEQKPNNFKNMKPIVCVVFLFCASFVNAEIRFTRVTDAAGIQFRHFNGATGEKHLVETMGGGVAFFDYDNDGHLDIYFVNGAPLTVGGVSNPDASQPINRLYRNNGAGAFSDVTQHAGVGDTGYGIGCCVADYDNDGNSDLFVTNYGQNLLYRNNGDGTFTDVTTEAGIVSEPRFSAGCAFADYDNDGWLDLVVVNYVAVDLKTAPDCSQAGIPAYCRPEDFAPEPDVLYRNNGDGTFTDVTRNAGIVSLGRDSVQSGQMSITTVGSIFTLPMTENRTSSIEITGTVRSQNSVSCTVLHATNTAMLKAVWVLILRTPTTMAILMLSSRIIRLKRIRSIKTTETVSFGTSPRRAI